MSSQNNNPEAYSLISRKHFSNIEMVSEFVRAEIGKTIEETIDETGQCRLMVTGGQTSKHYLSSLATSDSIGWDRVTLRLSDERFVPINDPDSNEGMIRNTLGPKGERANWHGLRGRQSTVMKAEKEAALRYDSLIWPTDLNLLGMGEDGHIASIFPARPEVKTAASVFSSYAADGSRRLSLSPSRLLNARQVYLITGGRRKLDILEHALLPGPVDDLPVRYLLHQTITPLHLITFD